MDINTINKENALIIRSCEKAASDLKRAWGKGDPRGRKQVWVVCNTFQVRADGLGKNGMNGLGI
jgi:hypothetical protein